MSDALEKSEQKSLRMLRAFAKHASAMVDGGLVSGGLVKLASLVNSTPAAVQDKQRPHAVLAPQQAEAEADDRLSVQDCPKHLQPASLPDGGSEESVPTPFHPK